MNAILTNWVLWIIALAFISYAISTTFEKRWYTFLLYVGLFAIDAIVILEVIIPNASH